MERNSKWFILAAQLLVVQCLSRICTSHGYDFFYFVQKWPGSYCNTKVSCCDSVKPPSNFTIHGLWPHNLGSANSPTQCSTANPFDASNVVDLVGSLEVNWPALTCPKPKGTRYWSREWKKHGTCSEEVLDQHSYFQAALNLKDKVNLLQILQDAGIKPSNGTLYDVNDIKKAIKGGTGFDAAVECNADKKRTVQISRVYLCADASGKELIECPVLPIRKCSTQLIQFPIF